MDIEYDNNSEEEQVPIDYSKYIKYTIYIAIAIGAMYFAYYYFYLSVVTLTISAEKKNGDSVSFSYNLLKDNKIVYTANTSEPISVRVGNYLIEPTDLEQGYYISDSTISISGDNREENLTIDLYPEWEKYIKNVKILNQSAKMYVGQTAKIEVSLDYEFEPSNVVVQGTQDLNKVRKDMQLTKGTNKVTLDYFVEDKYKGRRIAGRICIYMTSKCTQDINAQVLATPTLTIQRLQSKYTIYSGEEFKFDFIADNKKNDIELNDVNIVLESISGISEDVAKSIFTAQATTKINPKQTSTFYLSGNVPINMQKTTFTASFTLRNDIINQNLNNVTFDVMPARFSIIGESKIEETLAGSTSPLNLKLKNDSDTTISGIKISIDEITSPKNLPDDIRNSIIIESVPQSINPKSEANLIIKFNPKITFLSDDISFKIKLESNASTILYPVSAKIKGINFKPEITMQKREFSPTFTQNSNISEPESTFFSIKNSGDVKFTVNSSTISGDSQCATYSSLSIPSLPTTLEVGSTVQGTIQIRNIPKPSVTSIYSCNLTVSYVNPKTLTSESSSEPFTIKVQGAVTS